MGAEIGFGIVVAAAAFVATVIGFVAYPHVAIALTIPLFALVPMLKVFVTPEIGAVKDLVVVAAGAAALLMIAVERRQIDRPIAGLVALFLGLYIINPGGAHDDSWFQGLRLVAEPMLLLIVGLTLRDPQRTMRWGIVSLIATCCGVAAYGLAQQAIGKFTLVEYGYAFEFQVRTLANGQLRSFGTLDDSFAYAALLSFGLAAVLFWVRRGAVALLPGLLIVAGLVTGLVRTSVLVVAAFASLLLLRWGYRVTAVLAVTAILFGGAALLVSAGGSEARSYRVQSSGTGAGGSTANIVLNGRISAWEAALGPDPLNWVFGRGVGTVGTAAVRSGSTFVPTAESAETTSPTDPNIAVDSGYLAAIADVGFAGLLVLLALFYRLAKNGWEAARENIGAGWMVLGLLAALLVDALTRASFTGFPTAFLGMLLIGVCLAAANSGEPEGPVRPSVGR